MTYIRAHAAKIDAWVTLGNPGWNFASLLPYYLRSEAFTFPDEAPQDAGVSYDHAVHNQRGNVHTGYPLGFTTTSPYTMSVREAFKNLGVPHNVDSGGGNVYGISANPQTLDRELNICWGSVRAYLHPAAENRPNLKIIKGTGRRITWVSAGEGTKQGTACRGKRAAGIEYIIKGGQAVLLTAKKQVILSAGSLRSPLLLEASGVGNPRPQNLRGLVNTQLESQTANRPPSQ